MLSDGIFGEERIGAEGMNDDSDDGVMNKVDKSSTTRITRMVFTDRSLL